MIDVSKRVEALRAEAEREAAPQWVPTWEDFDAALKQIAAEDAAAEQSVTLDAMRAEAYRSRVAAREQEAANDRERARLEAHLEGQQRATALHNAMIAAGYFPDAVASSSAHVVYRPPGYGCSSFVGESEYLSTVSPHGGSSSYEFSTLAYELPRKRRGRR